MQRYNQALTTGSFDEALAVIDGLIADFPTQVPLYLHRARTLRALGRIEDARAAMDKVVALRGDHGPTLLYRAELRLLLGEDPEEDLRRAVKEDPLLAGAHLLLARTLASSRPAEASAALERALEIDPHLAAAYAERADWHRRAAAAGFGDASPTDTDTLVNPLGQRYLRSRLEQARVDYLRSLSERNDPGVRRRLAEVLYDLADYDAALAACDAALALTPMDDPQYADLVRLHALAEQRGRGELAEVEARVAQALAFSAAPAPRTTAPPAPVAVPMLPALALAEAQARWPSASAEQRSAQAIAHRLYALAALSEPQYTATRAELYPTYMREYVERVAQGLDAHGFRVVGDYEPAHLSARLPLPTVMRFLVASDGISAGVAWCAEPASRGWLADLWQRIRGRWQRTEVFELLTAFDDGGLLLTTTQGDDLWAYGGDIDTQSLAAGSSPAAAYAQHRQRIERYRQQHPGATAERLDTEARQLAIQSRLAAARRAYRHAIAYVSDEELAALLGPQSEMLGPRVRASLAEMIRGAG